MHIMTVFHNRSFNRTRAFARFTLGLCAGMMAITSAVGEARTKEKADTVAPSTAAAIAVRPVDRHGQLRVKGRYVVDKTGKPVSLAGMSLFWSSTGWGQEKMFNAKAIKFLAEDWRVSMIRVPLGIERDGGYLVDPEANKKRVLTVIDAAIDNGLYVTIDWHSHHAEDTPDAAEAFFIEMAQKYGKYPHVIYNVYNEPLNTSDWSTAVKPYSERIIRAIRKHDPDNIIVIGTPTWSQDVDIATADPIKIDPNIVYSLHFYAAKHKQELRDRAQKTIDRGFPLWIDEMGTVLHTADGDVDYEETRKWLDLVRKNKLSFNNWAVSDKAEGASILKPGGSPTGGWTDKDLTPSGLLMRDVVRNWPNPVPIKPR
jgi:endoglucanase